MLRDTYAEINLKALENNIHVLQEHVKTPLLAVVKADAYGHGAPEVAKRAYECGIKWMAVSNPDEAEEIREVCPDAKILVLSSVMEKACEAMVEQGISVTAYLPCHIEEMQKAAETVGKQAKVHLKADTGMGRIGFSTDEELKAVLDALERCPDVCCEGLFTHFATADEADLTFAEKQLQRYMAIKEQVFAAGHKPICHAANSAAQICMPEARFDLCRAGIAMYGYAPSGEMDMNGVKLTPVMTLKSYVSYVKTIHKGDTVSYGRIYTAEEDRRIATVPAGYADGYLRSLSNKGIAMLNGERVRQVGRVCMDQIMFDVTGISAEEGDVIELFGENVPADELAALAGTISYEFLTGITKRVPRVYVD